MNKDIIEFALEWTDRAEQDLLWAKSSYKDGFYSGACFLCQQVAEKSLKGFLYAYNIRVKTHNLTVLLTACTKKDGSFSDIEKFTSKLNPYYLKTRYPDMGSVEKFNKKEIAEKAIKMAEEVLYFVKSKLK